MSDAAYVAAGWLVVFVVLVAYAGWVLARGRRLARRAAPDDLPWR